MTEINPDSKPIKKYNYRQLAEAFAKIMKNPKIIKQTVPDVINIPLEIRKVKTWNFDFRYGDIEGISDLNNVLVKIMLYARPNSDSKPKVTAKPIIDNTVFIQEVQKQLGILEEQLIFYKLQNQPILKENTEKEITLKRKLLEKLQIAVPIKEEIKEEFTLSQIGAIAKQIFEILIDSDRGTKLYQELQYSMRPAVDHRKESTGGDYVLRNSTRDRRFTSDNKNWIEEKKGNNPSEQNTNMNTNTNASREDRPRHKPEHKPQNTFKYEYADEVRESRPSMNYDVEGQEQSSSSSNSKSRYVSPAFREEVTVTMTSTTTHTVTRSTYRPPHVSNSNSNSNPTPEHEQHTQHSQHTQDPNVVNRYKTPHECLHGHKYGEHRRFPYRSDRQDRPDRPDIPDRSDRTDTSDTSDRHDRHDRPDRTDTSDRPDRFGRRPYRPDDPNRFDRNRDQDRDRRPYRPDDPNRFDRNRDRDRRPYRPDDPNRFDRDRTDRYKNNRYDDRDTTKDTKTDESERFVNISEIKGQILLTGMDFPSLPISVTNALTEDQTSSDQSSNDQISESPLMRKIQINDYDSDDDDVLSAWIDTKSNDDDNINTNININKSGNQIQQVESISMITKPQKTFADIAREAKLLRSKQSNPECRPSPQSKNKTDKTTSNTNINTNINTNTKTNDEVMDWETLLNIGGEDDDQLCVSGKDVEFTWDLKDIETNMNSVYTYRPKMDIIENNYNYNDDDYDDWGNA